jgi:site-specific DNA-adenine methylase
MVLLSYIGGKARIKKAIVNQIPPGTSVVVSPFFGAGSVEFVCAASGIQVVGYDIFPELVQFWQQLKLHRLRIATKIERLLPVTKETYQRCRAQIGRGSSITRAVNFFVVNKCSFNGIMSGSYSPTLARQFITTPKRIRKFFYPPSLSVSKQDFSTTLRQHTSEFLFLDPPYYGINKTYGLKGEFSTIDHERLAVALEQRTHPWLLVYNDHPYIKKRYKHFFIRQLVSRYDSDREGKQLLIANYPLSGA